MFVFNQIQDFYREEQKAVKQQNNSANPSKGPAIQRKPTYSSKVK